MTWLASLPHQIPFRAASAVRRREERSIEGDFVWTANDLMPPELMLVEAMAQFAGGLAFRSGVQGFLTGIERCQIERAIVAGDRVVIKVDMEAEFAGIFRFSGIAVCDGVEVARGRFYLAAPDAQT